MLKYGYHHCVSVCFSTHLSIFVQMCSCYISCFSCLIYLDIVAKENSKKNLSSKKSISICNVYRGVQPSGELGFLNEQCSQYAKY